MDTWDTNGYSNFNEGNIETSLVRHIFQLPGPERETNHPWHLQVNTHQHHTPKIMKKHICWLC
jgi:hypothetical protein